MSKIRALVQLADPTGIFQSNFENKENRDLALLLYGAVYKATGVKPRSFVEMIGALDDKLASDKIPLRNEFFNVVSDELKMRTAMKVFPLQQVVAAPTLDVCARIALASVGKKADEGSKLDTDELAEGLSRFVSDFFKPAE